MWHQYKGAVANLEKSIMSEMKICSLNLECKNYSIDFIKKSKFKKDYLYKNSDELFMLFEVPTIKEFLLKVILDIKKYNQLVKGLKLEIFKKNILYIVFILFSSILFALYSLHPLKKALDLNEEFIKDILHDINTPISALIINLKLLKKEFGENKKLQRAQHSIDTIVSLQKNLKAFLSKSDTQKEKIPLKNFLQERINYFHTLYPHITFSLDIKKDVTLFTNKEAFIRILDNIIGNSCKYANEQDPKVMISFEKNRLIITDNGIGIKDVSKIFNRHYKEQSRGLGLGMHIVKKLCEALKIDIHIKSRVSVGTEVILDLKKLILN